MLTPGWSQLEREVGATHEGSCTDRRLSFLSSTATRSPSLPPLARVSPARAARLSRVADAVSFDPHLICSRVRRSGSRS